MNINIDEINDSQVSNDVPVDLFPSNSALSIDDVELQVESQENPEEKEETKNSVQIASIRAAAYGGLIKIIETVSKKMTSSDILKIKEGQIVSNMSGGYISSDLTAIFGKNNWELKDPNGALKRLKLIKGNNTVSIYDDKTRYIILNEDKGFVKQKMFINKTLNNMETNNITKSNPGELKYSMEIEGGIIANLITARASLNIDYYNLVIDSDTKELVSISINDEFTENFLTSAGRNIKKYRTLELFPVSKAEETKIDIYEDKNGVISSIVSFNDAVSKIEFQTVLKEIVTGAFDPSAELMMR